MLKKRSFQKKLLILFLVSIILPIMLLAAALAVFFQNKLTRERLEFSSSTLYSISNNLSTYASDLSRLALTPHIYDDIMAFYTGVQDGAYQSPDEDYQFESLRSHYITTLQRQLILAREDISNVVFMPADTDQTLLLLTSKYEELREVTDYPYQQEEWFQKALAANGSIIYTTADALPYQKKPTAVFSAVHKVKNVYSKKDIGIIRVDASDEIIRNIFANIKLSASSAFLLVDENDHIVYRVGNVSPDIAEQISEHTDVINGSSDTWDLYQQPIDHLSWRLIYLSSHKDMQQDLMIIWFLAAFLSIVSIFVAYHLFKANSNKITQSLHTILNAMETIALGDLSTRIPSESWANEEFLLIAEHLNTMAKQLERHIQQEYTYEISRQQAEYRALQSQINPHFLYNTLNNFVALNRLGMKQQLEDSIIHLTKMFRYTCNNREYTTVSEELDFCYQYIMLLKMRYQDQVDFVINQLPETADYLIPRLLIQPLVENAIKHGMDPSGQPVTITIEAFISDQCLVLKTANNGIPIAADYSEKSQCVGLNNIKNRIKIFHKQATFTVELVSRNITTITIIIPLDEEYFEMNRNGQKGDLNETVIS